MSGRCDGYGRDPHDHGGGRLEVRAPVPMHLCAECWRRWTRIRERPGRFHR